jgi:hypothetical protein
MRRHAGLGNLAVLNDELMLELIGHLSGKDLGCLAVASKSLYCFATAEDTWKALVLQVRHETTPMHRAAPLCVSRHGTHARAHPRVCERVCARLDALAVRAVPLQEYEGRFVWAGSWKHTYAAMHAARAAAASLGEGTPAAATAAAAGGAAGGRAAAGGAAGGSGSGGGAGDKSEAGGKSEEVNLELDLTTRKRTRGSIRLGSGNGGSGSAPKRAATASARGGKGATTGHPRALQVDGFYSDLLYQPWHCYTVDLAPDWLATDNVDRRSGLSVQQFVDQYERPNRPMIVTDAASRWRARERWDDEYLAAAFSKCDVIAGNYEMPYETYRAYCGRNTDEMPLYLFDKGFARKAPHLADDYDVPEFAREDLFSVLGEDGRPDYRWLIKGPKRSGSSFHVDPNSTSAWNAVVSGSKKWIMYPPSVVPPGVHPSPDGADVATPLSLTEWFLNFYEEAQEGKVKPLECVVRAGEVLFIPRGWWHMAMNLEDGVAVTQNFVSRENLPHVLRFLRDGDEATISGCPSSVRGALHERFVGALKRTKPEVYEEYEAAQRVKRSRVEADNRLAQLFKSEAAVASAGTQAAGGGAGAAGAQAMDVVGDEAGAGAGSAAAAPPPPLAATTSFSFNFDGAGGSSEIETPTGRAAAPKTQEGGGGGGFSFSFKL